MEDLQWKMYLKSLTNTGIKMRELSLHILDIVQNSLEAGANVVKIEIEEGTNNNLFVIKITDNGQGIEKKLLKNITDPFVTSRSTRNVGLGLSLLKEAATRCNGDVRIESVLGKGTYIEAYFTRNHIDRAPLGDITETLITLIAVNTAVNFKFIYNIADKEFVFDTNKVQKELGDITITHPHVLNWLREFLHQNITKLSGGEADEITERITTTKGKTTKKYEYEAG